MEPEKRVAIRLLLYKALTLAIMLFSEWRYRLIGHYMWELRKDRDEQNFMANMWFSKGSGILLECCDCGLSHRLFESDKGSHGWPERPIGYDYRWRRPVRNGAKVAEKVDQVLVEESWGPGYEGLRVTAQKERDGS